MAYAPSKKTLHRIPGEGGLQVRTQELTLVAGAATFAHGLRVVVWVGATIVGAHATAESISWNATLNNNGVEIATGRTSALDSNNASSTSTVKAIAFGYV